MFLKCSHQKEAKIGIDFGLSLESFDSEPSLESVVDTWLRQDYDTKRHGLPIPIAGWLNLWLVKLVAQILLWLRRNIQVIKIPPTAAFLRQSPVTILYNIDL